MKEDEAGDIAYADAETADQAGRRDYSMRSCRMTKEILAKRGLMNEYLRMSEGELSSLISSSGDDDHSCRPSSEMSFFVKYKKLQ